MNYDDLIKDARNYAETNYLNKDKLGHDEELPLLSCGYSVLFLSACAHKNSAALGKAREFTAQCFAKTGDQNYSTRHMKMAES